MSQTVRVHKERQIHTCARTLTFTHTHMLEFAGIVWCHGLKATLQTPRPPPGPHTECTHTAHTRSVLAWDCLAQRVLIRRVPMGKVPRFPGARGLADPRRTVYIAVPLSWLSSVWAQKGDRASRDESFTTEWKKRERQTMGCLFASDFPRVQRRGTS